MENSYPIRAAAKLTGIPLDTLRAWERRYAAVVPERLPRGRVYSRQQIERLILLREAVAQGHAIGQVAGLPDRQLAAMLRRGERLAAPAGAGRARVRPTGPDILSPILRALDRFDSLATERELNRLAAALGHPRDVVRRAALPLMRVVGERWHEGRCSIAQEHMLSNLLTALLASMVRSYSNSNPPARILLATPREERHGFPILAAAMLSAAGGLGVIYLGTDLPAADLVLAARRGQADAVLLSISAPPSPAALADIRTVGSKLARRARLWLGTPPELELPARGSGPHWLRLRDFDRLEQELIAVGARF